MSEDRLPIAAAQPQHNTPSSLPHKPLTDTTFPLELDQKERKATPFTPQTRGQPTCNDNQRYTHPRRSGARSTGSLPTAADHQKRRTATASTTTLQNRLEPTQRRLQGSSSAALALPSAAGPRSRPKSRPAASYLERQIPASPTTARPSAPDLATPSADPQRTGQPAPALSAARQARPTTAAAPGSNAGPARPPNAPPRAGTALHRPRPAAAPCRTTASTCKGEESRPAATFPGRARLRRHPSSGGDAREGDGGGLGPAAPRVPPGRQRRATRGSASATFSLQSLHNGVGP
ncbi:hypothetical protein BRADI_2g12956v3 [Brachypodium distachyon]|uniref:Uncharacterized protein n=1 Tax=Brachypodium distachyon TaxID=15368 RepID=A0A0Q3K0R4_BRADI|nr:hypothetical protein BRADI_2g12956v3 [Brachypodium distachyon]